MIQEEWGNIPGDLDADVIILDRKDELKTLNWAALISAIPFIPCLVWYALTGSRIAFALVILELAGIIGSSVERGVFKTHTFVMIAESRTRRIEAQLERLESSVADLERKSRPNRDQW